MILNCESHRGWMADNEILPGVPVVTCQAKCPKCGEYAVATFLGHMQGRELPKQIEHHCKVQK